jgi:hypothetical protein
MDDLLELYRQIRSGSIRPERSYESPQGGMSRAELEKELEQMNLIASKLEVELYAERNKLHNLLKDMEIGLGTLLDSLQGEWPFCNKGKLRTMAMKLLSMVASEKKERSEEKRA